MVARAIALVLLAVGLAVPAHADSTDDAFITNLKTSGMDYGAPDRAIQVAKTVVCGSLSANPNTSNADLVTKVTNATSWPALNAAYFTGAAIQAYCPQYGSLTAPSVPSKVPAPTGPSPTPPASPSPTVQSA
ncbi:MULTISPECIES: DUF732 domain-containing protein [Mycobacterium]|uniref:DUF732 domain-containing protein n=1 Tax=Mycobacterium kiyosense TaxID=2871094 RepID=A0A9P3QD75_9MYCO|nr:MULTISPECIES: DUF732 domain-containing protein [Mycobacterium]BDB44544.1 hypothetical protein IWGMT90018_49900 [Mycobacterium kiyosense]BDE16052.1 hypothetical protein MKCMC460_49120 [Mycobacterium sp. 20KCMC460]GLB85977.1 hypothetical protein SRL2020028_52330 [Mycobacterium kiyosense]GLB93036.1 hypothetical protein SRL2020130_58530 [Mycobacterium kiyosense]GLB98635.1 hypothetical protein SRL2020226_54110 [Mycobacterium kiyosense]